MSPCCRSLFDGAEILAVLKDLFLPDLINFPLNLIFLFPYIQLQFLPIFLNLILLERFLKCFLTFIRIQLKILFQFVMKCLIQFRILNQVI